MQKIATLLTGAFALGVAGCVVAADDHEAGGHDGGHAVGVEKTHETGGAEDGHGDSAGTMPGMDMMPESVDEMREMHKEHEHGHDFDVMDELLPDQLSRMMGLMQSVGVVMPPMDAARGRLVFVEKGCIACHSVNGVGGDLGPALNAEDMPRPMNSFEFVARMWRGARSMTEMQEDLLGEVISLDGQDLADLVVFAHDPEEQAKLTEDQIPERYHNLIHGE